MMSEEMLDKIFAPRMKQPMRTREEFEFAIAVLGILLNPDAKSGKWVTEPVL